MFRLPKVLAIILNTDVVPPSGVGAGVSVVGSGQFFGLYEDPGQLMDPENTWFSLCSSFFTTTPFSLFSQHVFDLPSFVDPL